jgi:hypothetical protein
MTTTTAPKYTAWTRTPGQPWRPIAEGATEAAALSAALARTDLGSHVDIVVLVTGKDPNRRTSR